MRAIARRQQLEATREALERAALELFGQRGYEATSASDVAAAVGVSERTFFRHFPTKDAVLFHRSRERFDVLGAALAAHVDVDHPTWLAIDRALATYAAEIEAKVERLDVVAQLIYETPCLAGRVREYRSLWHDWATDVLAARGDATRAALLAPMILAIVYRGQAIWVGGEDVTLASAMATAIAEARAAMPTG